MFWRRAVSRSTAPGAYPGAITTSAWAAAAMVSATAESMTRLAATIPPKALRGSQR